ncbi:Tyrocidine synthase 3 [compost metagenome]
MIDLGGFSFDMEEDAKEDTGIQENSLQDIAVIGMSVCLPGADHIDQFWPSVAQGEDLVIPFPEARREDVREYSSRIGLDPDSTRFFKGAYLTEIDKFDYPFFRLSPREASLMNPNQRIFLETAWKTIEDAGYGGDQLKGTKTGVFLGYCGDAIHDYKRLISSVDPSGISIAVPGNLSSIIAGRISYLLDLKGPAITVDTACSSSLVAIHLACQALRSGDCDTALAGSVKTLVFPADTGMRIGIESSDGRAKPFDQESDGTGMGEGSAAVLLKPLARAVADGDPIYAVIKGSAVNQDGSSVGISAPNVAAQEEVIVEAWMNAGIDPETISYIEAHGTGTKLGDPIEIEGINRAFRRYTEQRQFCAVGSVKSNLGHLDNAAGIVGFVKACLALKNKQLPPSLHFNRPNASIDFIESAVYVNRSLSDWRTEGDPRRCGISSFGLSGTNCHVVLEEAPQEQAEQGQDSSSGLWHDDKYLFTLSAQSPSSLSRLVDAYTEMLEHPDFNYSLGDLCYTANLGRSHHRYRLAYVVRSADELAVILKGLKDALPEVPVQDFSLAQGAARDHNSKEHSIYEWRELYLEGADVPWASLYRSGTFRRIHLPSYSFDKHRCWVENDSSLPTAPVHNPVKELRRVKLTGREDGSYSLIEQAVGEIWGNVLGFSELNINDHFYSLGGDSILAYQIAVKLTERLGKQVDTASILRNGTVLELAACLDGFAAGFELQSGELEEADSQPPDKPSGTGKYELTPSQLRIFVQEQAGGIGTSYNMPLAFLVKGELNPAELERALQKLVHRHDMLRTAFIMEKGNPVQINQDDIPFELEQYEAGNETTETELARFVRPFELSQAPLFRAALIRRSQHEHILLIDSHHLVSDGFSTAILVKEFFELYQGKNPATPAYSYRDYVEWREQFADSEAMVRQEEFWQQELSNLPAPLRLPLDRPRPSIKTFAGARISFLLDQYKSNRLQEAAASNQMTLNMLLFALYGLTILKYTDQEEAVIGSIVSGRQRAGQEGCVGMFINFIPVRLRVEQGSSLQQYTESVKQAMTSCYEHQDVPFERLVDFACQSPDRSRNPIYDTMLVFHNEYRMTGSDRMSVRELTFETVELPIDTATLDIKLDIFLGPEGLLDCKLNYNVDLFDEGSMQRLIGDFQKVIDSMLDEPGQLVENLQLFSKQETEELVRRRSLNDGPAAIKGMKAVVNATFTAEPIEEYLSWWTREFKTPVVVQFGGYNQVLQQLIHPTDGLKGGAGYRIILIRFEDLIVRFKPDGKEIYVELERQFSDLLKMVQSADKSVPYLFGIFPTASHSGSGYPEPLIVYIDQLYERWKRELMVLEQVHVVDFREAAANYSVHEIFDPVTDREGHMPFSEPFYAAMGTMLARSIISMSSAPFKVIALDCDHTLWRGVCGEDGPLGVQVEAHHKLLQRWMLERAQEGQLLTICSKNNEADVWAVFDQHPDMLLKKEHFVHWSINWRAKSENLKQMAKDLNLGLDSFVFIDDNPLECSEVMQNAPEVLALRLPADPRYMSRFLPHIWAWDRLGMTDEDRKRSRMYSEERNRRMELEASPVSMDRFMESLGLRMSMRTVADVELERAVQLTQRTNQFNLNGIRRKVEEVNTWRMMENSWCWVVEVIDRFGDYGIVGLVAGAIKKDSLWIDSFMLSCRVLGRGIEDTVMHQLKQVALMNGLRSVELNYVQTSKNEPFHAFLERVGCSITGQASEEGCNKGYDNGRDNGCCIPVEQIADGPRYVEVYFEKRYENRAENGASLLPKEETDHMNTQIDSAWLTASAASDLQMTKVEASPVLLEEWDPDIHWMPAVEYQHVERHQPYLKAISCSRADRILSLKANDTSQLEESRRPYEAPVTTTELRLAKLWAELLGGSAPGMNDHFFEAGGNSLKAASLVSKIHQAFGVELTIGELFMNASLSEMAGLIDASDVRGFEHIPPGGLREYYPVLSGQKRLFLLHELQNGLDGYNMPGVLLLEGQANIEEMEAALQAVIHRHEPLRTSFSWADGEIVQRIHSDAKLKLEIFEGIQDDEIAAFVRSFVRPFHLTQPPLLRAGLIRTVSGRQIVLIDMHHMISDGVSLVRLLEDFAKAYRGEALPPLEVQLKDYALWQQGRFQSGALEEHRKFWLDSFASPVPRLKLSDQGEASCENEGAVFHFRANGELRTKLMEYAADQGATLYMVLLAAYYVLLSKYTGQEDIVIGTPVAGRIRPELEPLIGMFVNTLALRSRPDRSKAFEKYLLEVRDLTLKALRYQEYPFELLVQELDIQTQPGQSPLFNTLFVMQNMEPFQYEFKDARLSAFPFDFGVSRFDLTLQAVELEGELEFTLEYRTALFQKDNVEQLAAFYIRILEQAASDPKLLLQDMTLLGEAERLAAKERILGNPSIEFADFDF